MSVYAQTVEEQEFVAKAPPVALDIIPLEAIDPNPLQPRREFDEEELKGLAQSIREQGVIQPIVVEITEEGRYILHDGERRLRASKLVGLTEIPAVVGLPPKDAADRCIRAIVANVQRSDLTAIELAQAFEDLRTGGFSDQAIADQVGRSRSQVTNLRRLLQLPEEVRAWLAKGELSERQALALLPFYQLPAELREKAASNWRSSGVLGDPRKLSSENIRAIFNAFLLGVTRSLDTFSPGRVYDLAGVREPACIECKLYIKADKPLCGDRDCFELKQNEWLYDILLSFESDIPIIKPSETNMYSNFHSYYEPDKVAVQYALECKCQHLRLGASSLPSSPISPEGAPKQVYYVCELGQKCACRQGVDQSKNEQESANRKEVASIRSRAIDQLCQMLVDLPPAILQSLALHFEDTARVRKLDKPEAWARVVAAHLLDRGAYQTNKPDEYRVRVRSYFAKLGLVFAELGEVGQFEERLVKIESYVQNVSSASGEKILLAIQPAIKGNLTNLAKLAEEVQAAIVDPASRLRADVNRLYGLRDRIDQAKSQLLAWRKE